MYAGHRSLKLAHTLVQHQPFDWHIWYLHRGFSRLACRSFEPKLLRLEFLVAFFLGIDGGGSKTRCTIGDEESQLGTGVSGSSKVQRIGETCARDSLSAAIGEACAQAGIPPRKVARTCAGITGAARPEVAKLVRELVMGVVGGEIEIVGDVEVAFEDAFGDGQGVIVIAGTGSIAFGCTAGGETARVGGWGYPFSDEGSGYWIGVQAVAAALRARDRGEKPEFLREVMKEFGAEDFDNLIVRMNARPGPDFATLFPIVLSASDRGDPVARQVLTAAGKELAGLAERVILRLFDDKAVSIAVHGGVLSNSSIVSQAFTEELRVSCRCAAVLDRAVDPARGALTRARRGFTASAH